MNIDYLSNKIKYGLLILFFSSYLSYGQSNENERLNVVKKYLGAVKRWDGLEIRKLSSDERNEKNVFNHTEFDLIEDVVALEDYNFLERLMFRMNLDELIWIKHSNYYHCINLVCENNELKINKITEVYIVDESEIAQELNKQLR